MYTHTQTHRSRLVRGLAIGAVLTGGLASSVSAATTEVEATDAKTFNPSSVTSAVGGSVHWLGTPGSAEEHSVRQDAGLFDSGTPAAGLDFSRTFSAGTFAYHCEKHADQGMTGQVKVAPQVLRGPRGLPFTVKWATAASNTGSRYDVQYRIGAGRWKTWLGNTGLRSKVFGAKSSPVRVRRGKTYAFRVVSRTSSTVKSGLSPVKSFRAR